MSVSNNFAKDVVHLEEEGKKNLVELIAARFKEKSLHKGVSEVISALVTHKPLQTIYVCWPLDPLYERALFKALQDTKREVPLVKLSKVHSSLVYEAIRYVSFGSNKDREVPRRFFMCRAFAF